MSNPKRRGGPAAPRAHSYWLYGIHAVRAALANPAREVRRLVATREALVRLGEDWQERKLGAEMLAPEQIARLLPEGAAHQGAAAEVIPLPERLLETFLAQAQDRRPLVLLDQVTDPHNVGAILRTSAAFGAGAVIVPRDHAPGETAALAKASSGGIEIVPMIAVVNLAQCMETLKKAGYWCAGLDAEAKQTLAEARLDHKTALVLGAEGSGLRRLTAERCDLLVRLPISPAMESLNVSNAAAIALYAITQAR
jgi:23S rRNA (guanosine2251-2'-O)-methyltransferase